MSKTLKTSIASVIIGLAAIPVTFAQAQQTTANCNNGALGSIGGIETCITGITGVVTFIFFAVAIIFILYAAFLYLTAAGNDERLASAKRALLYAIIAIFIAVLAPAIINLIETTFGNNSYQP